MLEYKVVPAPSRAQKAKGLKTTAERFARALAERINAEAAGGWQFLRTETLPCEERRRFGKPRETTQVMMIFARPLGQTRIDAGAALAAAQYGAEQGAGYGDDEAADGYAENYGETGYARAGYAPAAAEAPAYEDEPAYETPAYETSAHDAPAHDAPAPARRQEPVFRAGALRRGEAGGAETAGRAEPLLRPRGSSDDEA